MANVTIAGDIYTLADPEPGGEYIHKTEFGMLIEFESEEELLHAIKTGECNFTVFEGKGEG